MTVLLFDTETTGTRNPEIIEAAWLELDNPTDLTVLSTFEQRYRPSKPIELGALATHHIYDEELVHCPPSSDFALPATTRYIIGHNVDYDWAVAGRPPVKRICTLALARYFYPDIDSHNQSAMLYLICRPEARERLRNAHSALADVQNCHTVLHHLIQRAGSIHTWDDLWQLSEHARVPRTMPFGKHRGMPIANVPDDYKAWLLRQPDLDPYLIRALQTG